MQKFIISVTGHRAWKNRAEERETLFHATAKLVQMLNATFTRPTQIVLIHGCATGVDLWFGEHAMTLAMNLELYLPFPRITQIVKGKMSPRQADSLNRQIEYADKVVVVNKQFHYHGYEKRNWALVNRCNLLATYFTRSRSGSGNAQRYAIKKKVPVVDLRRIVDLTHLPNSIHHINELM
ncbi:MAG: hypothetical protein ACYTBJ_00810 [Planctomycetota bacterium]|jgi:hypothetical protein